MGQKKIVLDHLKMYGSITSFEAFTDYYITRLSDVIFRLRKEGYNIDSTIKTNVRGNKKFSKYTLNSKYQ